MSADQRLEGLERRMSRIENELGRLGAARARRRPPTLAKVRHDFVEHLRRHGRIDYVEFMARTGHPYPLVEKVLAELVTRGAIEEAR